MYQLIKTNVTKFLPLAVLYLLIMVSFLGNSDYESLIVLIAAIPLAIYIFTEDNKLKKYLQYLLNLFIAGIIVYWVTGTSGLFNGWVYGYYTPSLSSFSYFFTGRYGETGWLVFTNSALFTVDLKILFYIGIIFLALKTNHVGDEKFSLLTHSSVKYIKDKLSTLFKSRAMRFIVLSYAYLLMLIFVVAVILPFVDSSSSFNLDYLETVLWMLPLLFTALYILLYKKRWIVIPAKIIFFIILVIAILDRLYVILISGLDLVTVIPLLVSLIVLTWPLAHLYRDNIKKWFKFQKKGLINNS